MSNFTRKTKHPGTGEWHDAEWLDDYFGKHEYGIKFPDGRIYEQQDIKETQDDAPTPAPPQVEPHPEEGEAGEFSRVRLERLKKEVNGSYRLMAQSIQDVEQLIARVHDAGKAFYATQKDYVMKLQAVEDELSKPNFSPDL